MWCEFHRVAINTFPDFSNPTLTAKRFDTVICQQTTAHRSWVALVRAADPTIKALAYQSTPYTANLDFPAQGFQSQCPSGISEEQAAANTTWYAKTSGGAFLVNAFGTPPARMLDVGLTAVRNAWSANARFRAVPGGGVTPFDGVFADDVNNDNSGQVGATLPAAYASWSAWWTAQMGMFAAIYPSFTGAGLQLVPNMSQWGQGNRTATAPILSNVTGAHTEHWMTYYDGSPNGWYHQELGAADDCVAAGKKFMGTGYGTAAAARYGLASILLVASASNRSLTSFSWQGTGPDYGGEYWDSSFDLDLGRPVESRVEIGGNATGFNAFQRRFQWGWALVNPLYNTDGTTRVSNVTFNLGGTYSGSGFTNVSSVTLAPGAGAVFAGAGTYSPGSRLLPLDLTAEVTTAGGTRYKWDANQAPGSRPQNLSFRTKIGEGFSDSSCQLARRIDQDYPDLNLVDTVTFTGADGTIAYEGRNSAMPRDLSDRHSIGVTLAGWMAHAKDRKFAEIYVDRDIGQWGEPPIEQKVAQLTAGVSMGDFAYMVGQGGLTCPLPNQALGASTLAEAWYQAPPGVTIAQIGYRGTVASLPAGWVQQFIATDSRGFISDTLVCTLDDTLRLQPLTTTRRYVGHFLYSNGSAATPASGANVAFSKLAVYGNHGVLFRVGDASEPHGLWVSDIIKNIAQRFCPMLDVSGVQDNPYVVQHCAYRERTFPYDAFLDLNKYALWHLGVWDNRQLVYKPYDLSDYDWEIRTDDPGTTFSPQGPSTDSLYNGIAVTYTNPLTGVADTLTPDTNSQLADPSSTNPWNQWGISHWDDITLSTPALPAQALALGQAALADRNMPRTPGTITVRGYIRDRAGNQQPCWKVRAGDTISITNFPNDAPRLIVETDYDDEQKQVSLAIDKPFALLDAYLDRLENAVQASGAG